MEQNMIKTRLQTFSRLPSSWNLALVVAFVENLESTDWHLSSHSIGRTHPHRPGTVLANTTHRDIERGSYTDCRRYCMVKWLHTQGRRKHLNRENPISFLITLFQWYLSSLCTHFCSYIGLYNNCVTTCMSMGKGGRRIRENRWVVLACLGGLELCSKSQTKCWPDWDEMNKWKEMDQTKWITDYKRALLWTMLPPESIQIELLI